MMKHNNQSGSILPIGASSSPSSSASFVPGPFDVLCGRGKRVQVNPGNVAFQRMITEATEKIHVSGSCRVQVAKEIVTEIRNNMPPGRFLEYDAINREWKDIGDQRACEKARQALRDKACTMAVKKRSSETLSEDNNSDTESFSEKQSGVTQTSKEETPQPQYENPQQKRKIERVVERAESDNLLKCARHLNTTPFFHERRCSSEPGLEKLIRLPMYMIDKKQYPFFKDDSWKNVEEWDLDMKALTDDTDLLSVSGSNSNVRRESNIFSPIVHYDSAAFEPIDCYSANELAPVTRRRSMEIVLPRFTHSQTLASTDAPILQHPMERERSSTQKLNFEEQQNKHLKASPSHSYQLMDRVPSEQRKRRSSSSSCDQFHRK